MSANDEEWLNVDGEIGEAKPGAAAHVLESIAETLRESPDEKRYDVEIEVTEID